MVFEVIKLAIGRWQRITQFDCTMGKMNKAFALVGSCKFLIMAVSGVCC